MPSSQFAQTSPVDEFLPAFLFFCFERLQQANQYHIVASLPSFHRVGVGCSQELEDDDAAIGLTEINVLIEESERKLVTADSEDKARAIEVELAALRRKKEAIIAKAAQRREEDPADGGHHAARQAIPPCIPEGFPAFD